MRHRTLVAMTTTALLAALATGCRDAGPEPTAAPTPHYTEVSVPAELMPSEVMVDQAGLLGADGEAPWSVHAIRTAPGDRPRAVVWAAQDGVLPDEPVDLDADGDAESLVVAGSATLTVAVIGTSTGGEDSTTVLTSTDRRKWTTVSVPLLDDVAVTAAAVSGDDALIVGTSRVTDEPKGVSLTAGGQWEEVPMPTSSDGVETMLHPDAVAIDGHEVAVVTSQDRGGVADVVSVYRSINRGGKWVEDVIEGDHVRVSGFTATASGFVLTGHVRFTRGAQVLTRAGVWTAKASARGFAPVTEPPTGGLSDDVWIGAPARSGDGYQFLLSGPYVTTVAMFGQDGDMTAISPELPERGMLGQTAVDADGTTRAVVVGKHGATVLEIRRDAAGDGDLVPVAQLAAPHQWFTPYGPRSMGVLTVGMRRTEDWRDGWRSYAVQGRYVLDADGTRLIAATADAIAVDESSWRVDMTGPDGEVALVSRLVAGGDVVETVPWARRAGGRWVQGPSVGNARSTHAPGWVAGEWLLPGTTARSADVDEDETATLWSSPDGLTWSAVDGFPGVAGQDASTVCALGEQDAIVLGSDHGLPMMWVRSGGSWQTSPATQDGRRTPTSCHVAADGRTVIRFAESDGVRLLATTDGSDMDEVLATGDDSGIGTVCAVPGGFAAAGWVRDEGGQHRSALWVSTDGVDWRHLDGPDGEDDLADLTVIDGTVVVMTDDDRGTRVWRVDGLRKAMSAASAKMDG